MKTGKNLWGMHGQERNTFLSKKYPHVGLGWNKLGDVTQFTTKQEFEERYIQIYGSADKSMSQTVGQNYRFIVEAEIGDYVVYSKDRVIHIGVFKSKALHNPDKNYSTIREVQWLTHAPASILPTAAYNEINSALSFFSLKNNPLAFLNILDNNPVFESELYKTLKTEPDINSYEYDGSYELLQYLSKQYEDFPSENIDYKDLDALYLSVIGTWKVGFNKKKQKVMDSNLSIDKKKNVIELIEKIEDKTNKGLYTYSEYTDNRYTMGLFGTGFMTFKDSDPNDIKKLIQLIININKKHDEDMILDLVENELQKPMHGIKTGVVSVLFHCLKPDIFPVFNRNMGAGLSVFSELGIGLNDPIDLETYAENVRLVIDFRDEHFSFKNFRVLDMAARLLSKEVSTIIKTKTIDNIVTAEIDLGVNDWIEILSNKSITNHEVLEVLKLWYNQDDYEASCKELSDKNGDNFGYYNATIMNYGKKIAKEKHLDVRNQNDEKTYWSIIMNGRNSVYNDTKVFNWILKEEVVEAMEELNLVSGNIIIEEEKVSYNEYTKKDFLEEAFMSEDEYDEIHRVLLRKSNIILQGSPGVGKTYLAKRFAYSILGEKDDSAVEMVQFHQSYSYEDFVFGYHPTETSFELKPGIFYSFCKKAEKNPNKLHFFIIDEINRGNLSKIFGELLMLIEEDKRGTSITLSHTKEAFSVPKNIYIIGMMNTADRSLAIIDYALRRRFSFIKINPAFNKDKFESLLIKNEVSSELINKIVNRFNELNKEIEKDPSLGSGFAIGHSYFCECKHADEIWYKEIIQYDIKPILEEYWFDNPEKVERFMYELLK